MSNSIKICFDTLTPLWTGNADQKVDRIRETGILGSLRWWYEIFVRSQGYDVCDPSAEEKTHSFDTEAYHRAKDSGMSEQDAIRKGLKNICPVCYVFGATGWARLFQLRAVGNDKQELYFLTSLQTNQSWLEKCFPTAQLQLPFGKGFELHIIPRGYDDAYAIGQVRLAIWLAATYGGLGARLQHGFGQIRLADSFFAQWQSQHSIRQFRTLTQALSFSKSNSIHPFTLKNFFSVTYYLPNQVLSPNKFQCTVGKKAQTSYIPCVFDLRYKGHKPIIGMRQWLKTSQKWDEDQINAWLGHTKQDKCAGKLFFGMPHREGADSYQIRVFGFAPCNQTAQQSKELCDQYFNKIFKSFKQEATLGTDLLREWSNDDEPTPSL